MVRKLFIGAVLVLLGMSATSTRGQDTLLDELYGRGVHSYFSRDYRGAQTALNAAIAVRREPTTSVPSNIVGACSIWSAVGTSSDGGIHPAPIERAKPAVSARLQPIQAAPAQATA